MIANFTDNINYIIRQLKRSKRLLITDSVIHGLIKTVFLMTTYLISILAVDYFFPMRDVILLSANCVFFLLIILTSAVFLKKLIRYRCLKYTAAKIEAMAGLNQNLMVVTDYYTGGKEYNYSSEILANIAAQLKEKFENISLVRRAGLSKVYFRLFSIICSFLLIASLFSFSGTNINKYIRRVMLMSESLSPKTDFQWYLPQKIITAEPDTPIEITAYARGNAPEEAAFVLTPVTADDQDNAVFKELIQREKIESNLSAYKSAKSFRDNENYEFYFKYKGIVSPAGRIYTGYAPRIDTVRITLTDPNGTISDFSFEKTNPVLKVKKDSSAEIEIQIRGSLVNAEIREEGAGRDISRLDNVKQIYFRSSLNKPRSYVIMLKNIACPDINKVCGITFIFESKKEDTIFAARNNNPYDETISKERKKYLKELYKLRDLNRQRYIERTAVTESSEEASFRIDSLKRSLREIRDALKTAKNKPSKEIFDDILIKHDRA